MKTSLVVVFTAAAVQTLGASPGLARPISPQPDWLTGRGVWGELRLGWDLAAAASAQTASGC